MREKENDIETVCCLVQLRWAHGVVVSHPLRMRKALGSNPSVSILRAAAKEGSCDARGTSGPSWTERSTLRACSRRVVITRFDHSTCGRCAWCAVAPHLSLFLSLSLSLARSLSCCLSFAVSLPPSPALSRLLPPSLALRRGLACSPGARRDAVPLCARKPRGARRTFGRSKQAQDWTRGHPVLWRQGWRPRI